MPLNRITGNNFGGSPVGISPQGRPYRTPQQALDRIQGISRRLQEVLANPQPSPTFSGGLQEFGSTGSRGWGEYPEFAQAANTRQSPLQPAPPEIDLSPAARNQRTSLGVGRMMPGGEQMQDRFMGGSPLAGQANYLAQGQAMEAAGLGVMIPGPYGQIGQFIPKRQGVMEDVEASMPGRRDMGGRGQGFTRRDKEGRLGYTSRAQALRDAGNTEAAILLEDELAERVEKVKEGRRAMGLPVGPAERRAERDQKKMDRMLKVQGRRLQQMGVSPLSPQAALIAPEAFERAREAMQGGAGGGASPLVSATGEPVTPVRPNEVKSPVTIDRAKVAAQALLQRPVFKAAGVEAGDTPETAPTLQDVVPKITAWAAKNPDAMDDASLKDLHEFATQAAYAASGDSDPFSPGRFAEGFAGHEQRTRSLDLWRQLSTMKDPKPEQLRDWWRGYYASVVSPPPVENEANLYGPSLF